MDPQLCSRTLLHLLRSPLGTTRRRMRECENPDAPDLRLLRPCGKRPRRRTTQQRDELAPFHRLAPTLKITD